MRTISLFGAVAVFGATTIGFASPVLAADPSPSPSTSVSPSGSPTPPVPWIPVILNPSTASAGATVSIFSCEPDKTGTATSSLFGTVNLHPANGFTAYGEAKVPADAKPGKYQIKILCSDGRQGSTVLTVVGSEPAPQTTRRPSGAPETGVGGAASEVGTTSFGTTS